MAEIAALARPAPERFDGLRAWAGLPEDVRDLIGALALEFIAAWHLKARCFEDGLGDPYERIAERALVVLGGELQAWVLDALPEDAFEGGDGRAPRIPAMLGGVCRVCGCSQDDACAGGCGWAAEDLCTACAAGTPL